MKIPRAPHRWDVTPRKAIAIQKAFAARVLLRPPRAPIRFVAGLDAAFSTDGRDCLAAVVLWDAGEGRMVEQHIAARPLRFPYVPGLLSFREAPAVLAALRKLKHRPDVLMYDGHGVAHPRRFGIASHVGLITDLSTIGCAKSRLVGSHDEPAHLRGSIAALEDRGELIGNALRTQDGVRPVFVSIGHRMDLKTANDLVLRCAGRYRLPEPTRLADRLVAAAKRR